MTASSLQSDFSNDDHRDTAVTSHFAAIFAYVFYLMSAVVLATTLFTSFIEILKTANTTQFTIKIVNGGIIALALFELASVISAEYAKERTHDIITMMKRTLPRFIGTVVIALSLEGLMMVIKYSQLDLAGNLYYPVAIIVSASFLLIALGLFIYLADRAHVN